MQHKQIPVNAKLSYSSPITLVIILHSEVIKTMFEFESSFDN